MTERTATMTAEEARAHLDRLGLTQGDFTRLMAVDDRRARRLAVRRSAHPARSGNRAG